MHTAAQVSIGGRKQVLEDGADVCNSDSDSENEDFGEELTGMYKNIPLDSKVRQVDARYKLSSTQAAALRAKAERAPVADICPEPPKRSRFKEKTAPPGDLAPTAPKSAHGMTTRSKTQTSEVNQEGSVKLVPLSKKRKASRAGGLRPAVGSGSTDTCVAPSNPSQT
jgi:hypothetical protein